MSLSGEPARVGHVELGSFRLLGLLGEGAFATVYLAEQLGTDRRAVVKIAHNHLMQRADRAAIQSRFLDEVRASTRAQHPNMVTVYTAGETHDGLPAIAMEFVPGDSFEATLMRSSPLRTRELTYFAQLASALATVHRLGIVHRDVTPANIMVTRDHDGSHRAKLLDFGIAAVPGDDPRTSPMGTPRYAAPEQIKGRAVAASDVHGLGAILWWALTGRQYLHQLQSLDEIIAHQLQMREAPDPRDVFEDIAPGLAQMTKRMLAPDPGRRPTSGEVLDEWPTMIGAARAWRRRNGIRQTQAALNVQNCRALRLVIIDAGPIKRYLVGGYAERLGCEIAVAEDPRDATRGLLGDFDVAILATELPRVDAAAVSRHLREHFPKQRVVLMSSAGERVLDCAATGADIHLSVPGELGRLGDYLDTMRRRVNSGGRTPIRTLAPHEPVSGTVLEAWQSRPPAELDEAVRSFIGTMPSLIVQLDAMCHGGSARSTEKVCEMIEQHAGSLGALHLVRLAKSIRILNLAGELSHPEGFVTELESEYQRVFRRLVSLIRR